VSDAFQVLIGHEGKLRGEVVFRDRDNARTKILVKAGWLKSLASDEEVVPEQPGTYDLEPQPAKVVKRPRGKQAKAGQGDGEVPQPPADVEVRDEDNGSHGVDGES
jgi:hypothetical protein